MENQKLHSAKLLGGIGSILMLLCPIPAAGWLIAFVGFILVLVAVKYIADEIKDHNVFTNYLLAFIIVIVGAVVAIFIIAFSYFSWGAGVNWTQFQNMTSTSQFTQMMQTQGVVPFLSSIIAGLLVLWICTSSSPPSSCGRVSTRLLARTHTPMFHTTGLLYLIGAATAIILVGFIIIFVAFILQIIAFFSMPETLSAPAAVPPPMQPGMPPQSVASPLFSPFFPFLSSL